MTSVVACPSCGHGNDPKSSFHLGRLTCGKCGEVIFDGVQKLLNAIHAGITSEPKGPDQSRAEMIARDAKASLARGSYESAINQIDSSIGLDPGNLSHWWTRSRFFLEKGDASQYWATLEYRAGLRPEAEDVPSKPNW